MSVYVWDDIEHVSPSEVEECLRRLPQWRREQAEKYRFLTGRRDCALSYLLLCQALEKEHGITAQPTFVFTEHGKPMLKEHPDIHFNISHCAKAVACIVGDSPVGIDVESTGRRISPSLVRYTMNEAEQQEILASPLAFYRLWTRKEALVKMLGTGLNDDIPSILSARNLDGILLHTEEHSEQGYVLSTAQNQDSKGREGSRNHYRLSLLTHYLG